MIHHIKAREIFMHAVRFVSHHIHFTAYYFFLMMFSELLQVARSINLEIRTEEMALNQEGVVGAQNYVISFWRNMLSPNIIDMLQQPYMPYVLFGLTFCLLILFISITFIIQALIRRRETTLVHEAAHSFSALLRAPWALLYVGLIAAYMSAIGYLVPMQEGTVPTFQTGTIVFIASMFIFLVAGIALFYYQQLLYDNYSSLSSVVETSWSYLKRSWFVVLKYFIIVGVIGLLFAAPFLVVTALTLSPLAGLVQFLLRTYIGFVAIIGYNMIYNAVRGETR